MIYNIYQKNGFKKSINWVGEYTFGTIFFRGVHVHLQKKCGLILGYYDDHLDHHLDSLDNVILKEDHMFWNDFLINLCSLDELLDDKKTGELKAITFSYLEEIVDHIGKYDYFNYPLLINSDIDHNRLKLDFYSNYDKIKDADKIFSKISEDMIFVIFDFDKMVEELKEVKEIGLENGVSLELA